MPATPRNLPDVLVQEVAPANFDAAAPSLLSPAIEVSAAPQTISWSYTSLSLTSGTHNAANSCKRPGAQARTARRGSQWTGSGNATVVSSNWSERTVTRSCQAPTMATGVTAW